MLSQLQQRKLQFSLIMSVAMTTDLFVSLCFLNLVLLILTVTATCTSHLFVLFFLLLFFYLQSYNKFNNGPYVSEGFQSFRYRLDSYGDGLPSKPDSLPNCYGGGRGGLTCEKK